VLADLRAEDSGGFARICALQGAAETAGALLAGVLQADYQGGAGAGRTVLGRLLALHALCTADASVVTGGRDPARFVRSLAPYIKVRVE
jgi:hypothetical protein